MIKHLTNNKEINQKIFKFMIMHLAPNHLHFPYIQHYITNATQKQLLKLKLYLLSSNKASYYKQQIIPEHLPIVIKQQLENEIDAFINQEGQNECKQYIVFLFQNTNKISRTSRNICFLSGRSRAIYRIFHLSRLKIREHAQHGQFIGFKKISW